MTANAEASTGTLPRCSVLGDLQVNLRRYSLTLIWWIF